MDLKGITHTKEIRDLSKKISKIKKKIKNQPSSYYKLVDLEEDFLWTMRQLQSVVNMQKRGYGFPVRKSERSLYSAGFPLNRYKD